MMARDRRKCQTGKRRGRIRRFLKADNHERVSHGKGHTRRKDVGSTRVLGAPLNQIARCWRRTCLPLTRIRILRSSYVRYHCGDGAREGNQLRGT